MSVDDSLLSFLSSYVLVQKKPITYRLLSRDKNLHVSDARNALESFHKSRKGKDVKATYVLQGRLEENGQSSILLVGEDRLEETKSTFQQTDLTVQIYSVSPGSSSSKSLTHSDLAFFSTVPLTLSSDKTYTTAWEQADRGKDFGVIYNERTKKGDPRAAQAAQELQKANASAAANVSVKQEKAASTAKAPAQSSSSTAKAPHQSSSSTTKAPQQSTSKPAGGSGLNWSKAKSKPAATKAPPAKAVSEDEGDSDVEMAQIGYADSDGEADEKPSGSSRVKRADGVVSPSTGTTFTSGSSGKGKSDAEREEQHRKLREMMEVEEDQDGPGEAVPADVATKGEPSTSTMKGTESNADSDVEMQAAPTRRKIRRRKRTVRKERSKDAKGYMVTKEVSDYESYSDWTESEETAPAKGNKKKAGGGAKSATEASSSSSTAAKAKPKAAPATEPRKSPSPPKAAAPAAKPSVGGAKKGGGGGAGGSGQSKLSSFFKKG